MTSLHPSNSQLQDLLDSELNEEARRVVQSHVQGCTECQQALASARSLLHELESLSLEAQKVPPAWMTPKRYFDLASFLRHPAIATATMTLIFAAGILVGSWMKPSLATQRVPVEEGDVRNLAEEVQYSGSQYVMAIANWRRSKAVGSDAEQGREAALATLYGAAYELQKVPSGDSQLKSVVGSIADMRNRASKQSLDGPKENRHP